MRRVLSLAFATVASAACEAEVVTIPGDVPAVSPTEERSNAPRAPAMSPDLAALATGNAAFGLRLHRAAAPAGRNTVVSPYSVSVALAMARAGAVGATAAEMDAALHYTLPGARLHAAFNAMSLQLAARPAEATASDPEPDVPRPALQLRVVNDLWAQRGFALEAAYLDVLATWYGAGVRRLDFAAAPEPSRNTINRWIAQQTAQRIPELIPGGAIDGATKLVLTNAVYFNARWLTRFNPDATREEPFTRADGGRVMVRMMSRNSIDTLPYAEGAGWRAVELPYVGDKVAMLLVVPDAGTFADFERGFDGARYDAIVSALAPRDVSVRMPRFTARLRLELNGPLRELGMRVPFAAGADFSGITRATPLVIAQVLHEGFIEVTEAGTEAAAATAVIFADGGRPPDFVSLTVDRPFYYVIRDRPTGAMLFLGRMTDPTR